MPDIPILPPAITITKLAAQTILNVMGEEQLDINKNYLRIGITGGGCSGLQYLLDFTESPSDEFDQMFEQYGVKIVVDYFSAAHLFGTTIDYKDSLTSTGFKFENPNIVRQCGCGSSFST